VGQAEFKDRERVVQMSREVLERMEKAGIVPIVVIEDPSKVVELGKTIQEAGLDLIEITMRTQRAIDAIEILKKEMPHLLVGAGTIFSLSAMKEALSAGARFIVSPHLNERIINYCVSRDIVCIPGVFTASEVQRAIEAATKKKRTKDVKDLPLVIKIFPASTGGPSHIKAMKAVFPGVRFLPLGGVSAENLSEYIKAGAWAVGGTWICKKELIESGDFATMTKLIKEAKHIIAEARDYD